MQVLFATGNDVKFQLAQEVCQRYGITIKQTRLDVPEIQSEDATIIVQDKIEKGFNKLRQPLIISDDSWIIPGLNGFPGPYMKSINHWFGVEDWLNLTRTLQDRRIFVRQIVAYQDSSEQKIFSRDVEGILLTDARGRSPFPHSHIISFDGGQRSDAEAHAENRSAIGHHRTVWDDFAEWYTAH